MSGRVENAFKVKCFKLQTWFSTYPRLIWSTFITMTAAWEQEVTAAVLMPNYRCDDICCPVCLSVRPSVQGMRWRDVVSHWLIRQCSTAQKVTSLPQTPHFTLVFPRCFSLKHIISNCTAMLSRSESTLKHQTWFWSQEDVEPAENSWRGEVRPSVLQKCGDAAKPGKRTENVTVRA